MDNVKEKRKNSDMCNIPDEMIKSLKEDIAEIKTALLGNKYQKKGLIERVELIEYELDRFKKLKWSIYGGATVIAFIVSIMFRIVTKLI